MKAPFFVVLAWSRCGLCLGMLSTRDIGSKGWLVSNETRLSKEGVDENVMLLAMLLGQQDTYLNQTSETLMMIAKDMKALFAKLGASSEKMRKFGVLVNETTARVETRLLTETNKQQQCINDYFDALENCNRRHHKDTRLLQKLKKSITGTIKIHKKCRNNQAAMQQKSNECNSDLNISRSTKDSTKSSMVELDDKVQTLAKLMCGGPTDAPVAFATFKVASFRKAKQFFAKLEHDHKRALQEFANRSKKCLRRQNALMAVTDQCNSAQTTLMKGQCLYRQTEHKRRDAYQSCYSTKLSEYYDKVVFVKKETATRKAQWQSLMLVSCVLKSFFSQSAAEVPNHIAACYEKEFDTGPVDITYEPLQKMSRILRVPPLAPCDSKFTSYAFSGIPESIPLRECLSCPMPAHSGHSPLKKHCVSMETGKRNAAENHTDAGHFSLAMDGKTVFDGYLPFGDPIRSCISASKVPRIEVQGSLDAWVGKISYRATKLTAGMGNEPESTTPWRPLMMVTGLGTSPIFIGGGVANGSARAVCENGDRCALQPAGICVQVLTSNREAVISVLFEKVPIFSGKLTPAPGENEAELIECSARSKPKVQVMVPKDKGPWDGSINIASDATKWHWQPVKRHGVTYTETKIDAGHTVTLAN